MLRFTTLINFSLVGAIVAPAAFQKGPSVKELSASIEATENSLRSLQAIQGKLKSGDESAVKSILAATESPFGSARDRSQLMDQLRREIGELEFRVEETDAPIVLEHLNEDPTESVRRDPSGQNSKGAVATTGMTTEELSEVGNIWPPIPTGSNNIPVASKDGGRLRYEKSGFTVDAVRQGRAYYRAARYLEALRLFETRKDDPQGDYWIGRTLERLDRPQEAIAAYTRVIENEEAGAIAERAKSDREFVMWMVDFDRKLTTYGKDKGGSK